MIPSDINLKDRRIVIIDDSRAFTAGLKSLIVETGAIVECFQDPVAAIEPLLLNPPDVLVCDLEMPLMDGFAVVEKLRQERAFDETPILVLTGNEDPAVMLKTIQIGADSFAIKDSVRTSFLPQLLALSRLRENYKSASRGRQLEAVKVLIGTYKHDFGNLLAGFDGKMRRLERTVPQLATDDSFLCLKELLKRFEDTLMKLNALRKYEEEKYSGKTNILKIG